MATIYGRFGPGRTETIVGTTQDDDIYPLGGNDVIDGGRGRDTVHVEAKSTEFRISTINGVTYLDVTSGASSGEGVTLRNIETVVFRDKRMSLEVNDRLIDRATADILDGGPGRDTFVIASARSEYIWSANYSAATLLIKRQDASRADDFLTNVERLEFAAGQRTAFDMGATDPAGQAVLLIGAVLGKRLLPLKEELMGTVIGLFDDGQFSMQQLAGALLRLPIWGGTLTPSNSNADIARYLLRTVDRAEPTEAAVATGVAALSAETPAQQGSWLAQLAQSAANQVQVDLVGLQSTGFQYTVVPGGA
jgi:Ca2+-binding RTX toxin-like protein